MNQHKAPQPQPSSLSLWERVRVRVRPSSTIYAKEVDLQNKDCKLRLSIPFTAVCIVALMATGCRTIASVDEDQHEAKLIAVLKGDAGWLEKQAACRELRVTGTVKSVPALAALLPDEKLSHMARYALEPMPYPEVGQALRDALAKTSGMAKVGVITSIGVRRDAQAVPLLVQMLKGPDMDIARSAAGALGRIATPEAANALFDFRSAAPKALRPALAEGLLAAGQRFVEEGKANLAVPIYRTLLARDWPMHVRAGAFRGLAYAQPNQAPNRLIEALGGRNPLFRDMAAQIIAETSDADSTKVYAAALPKLPTVGQSALLRGLADRGDRRARPAVASAVNSPDRQVKLAAVKALGSVGSARDVATLAGLLASTDAEIAGTARASLTTIQGRGVDRAAAGAVPKVAPAVRAQLIEILTTRQARQTVPVAVNSLNDTDALVRIAALRALAPLGGQAQAPVVADAVKKAADSSERSAAEKALGAICSRYGNDVLPVVLDAMSGADRESRIVLLRALGRIGSPKALKPVLAALKDSNEQEVSDEAVRVLSNWPTLDAAPHLLELAQSNELNRHVLGLRGYVRLARTESSPQKKTRMLMTAVDMAKRPDEKKLVMAALGTLPTGQSLDVLLDHLDDATVRNEAASAIIEVATNLGKKNKPRAVAALQTVIEKCKNARIRKSAQKTLTTFE